MAHGNRADAIDNDYKLDTDGEAVVNIKNYQQPEAEEEQNSEVSAFEQVMKQMNINDRISFDQKYAQLWNEASDTQEMLSVLICEIDFFKEYHENYGQQAASFMLLVIALALKTTCEEHDCYLARYNGDEFGILIKGSDARSASEVAEQLRSAVEKSRTEHKYSTVADIVTLSIGVSSVYPTSMKVEMQQAVVALSNAKVAGRNQVAASLNFNNNRGESVPAIESQPIIDSQTLEDQQDVEFLSMMQDMGIKNEVVFDNYFESVWHESSRDQELLSMLDCELDFYNEYTDHYGKKYANDITLVVAIALKEKCDEIGCFFAHKGDGRFSIIIHGGNATKGLKVSETIKASVQNLKIEHLASPIKKIFTVSIGLSNIFPSELNTKKILVSKVNAALNVAKNNGYDQIGVEI